MLNKVFFIICFVFLLVVQNGPAQGDPVNKVSADVRCSICGMFVAKYDDWIVQVQLADKTTMFFDGVKDMMVFYHNPQKYSSFQQKDIKEIWVKDYYSLKWLDGFQAVYVIGSDVYGPMGKEFIPFNSKGAAENFFRDHKGKRIVVFSEITDELVQSMRSKMKMRHND